MEKSEKQIFNEIQEKQSKLAKKCLLLVMGLVGLVFTIISIIFFCINLSIKELPIIFLSLGLFLITLGIILYFIIPTKYSYDKYKLRVKKYSYMGLSDINIKIAELEERIKNLENKNK